MSNQATYVGKCGDWPTRRAAHEDCIELVEYIQLELCRQEGYVLGSLIADVDEHIGEHPEVGVRLAAIRAKYQGPTPGAAGRGVG